MKHYRPEPSTAEERKDFSRIREKSAQFILDGGLRYEPVEKYMQVHHSAWEPLAYINLKGILTFDSQDAVDAVTGKTKPCERSYVMGLMLPSEALTFVNNINIWNDDKIALICFEAKREQGMYAEIALTCMFDESSGTWFASNSADAFTSEEQLNLLYTHYKIPESLSLYAIQVFDTKWGRSATSRNGLFNSIFKALDPTIRYPRSLREAYSVRLQ